MSDDRELVRPDPTASEPVEPPEQPLAEVIAQELSARISARDRLETVEDAHGVAESIADAILDRFVVRPRPPSVRTGTWLERIGRRGVILEVRDLSVAYGAKKAVDGVSLQIARGEIFGLLGPNGAGKTSTLSAIEGLIKPQSGTVFLDGIDIRRHPSQAKAKLGVQLQATSFQPQLTIKQIVRLYAGLYGVALSDGEITEGLKEIGLEERRPSRSSSSPAGSSNGSRCTSRSSTDRRCCCSTSRPPVSIPQSRRQLWGRIEQIRQQGGSILLTTHSMEEAEAVCDRVAIIDHGTLLTTETPQDLIEKHKDDPEVRRVAHGEVTLEDVFIGLTGSEIRE